MFEQVGESLRKATEVTAQVQQEMFRRWLSLWPGFPVAGHPQEPNQLQRFQQQWGEEIKEAIKRQRDLAETQFKAGVQIIEKSFQVGEVKTPEELRARAIELWRQCFDSLRQTYESQAREFQTWMEKWIDRIIKPAA